MFGNTSFAEVPFSSIPAAVGGGSFQVAWARNANVLLDGDSIMQKNTAGQKIGVQMVSATDGSAFTGAVTVSVTGDAGTQATGSVGSGACTHEGNGYHTYAPAQAETNYDLIAFTFTGTGAVPSTVQVYTSFDANVTKLLGTAWLTPTTAGTPDVNTKTITDGIITAAKLAADAITAAKLAADVATEIQSGLATAAGVADVQTDVDDLQTRLPAALIGGRMDSSVEALAGGVITDAAFAANAILDTAIDASVGVEIADAVGNVGPVQDILTRVKGISPVNGTIGTTGNTTTTLHLMGLAYADDAINSMMLVIQDVSTGLYYARWIEDWADTGDLATVATLPFTPQASTDLYWILPRRVDLTSEVITSLAIPTAASNATAVWAAGTRTLSSFGSLVTDIATAVWAAATRTLSAFGFTPDTNVVNWKGSTAPAMTGDAFARLGAPAGASVSADIATAKTDIVADTEDLQSRLPAALTAGGNIKADALAIDGSATAADRLQRSAEAITFATVGSGSTTTSIVTSAIDPSASVADQFKGRIVIFDKATTTAALRGQATDITASTSGGVLTVTALTTAPASGDTFTIT